jgi:hypothetical protein
LPAQFLDTADVRVERAGEQCDVQTIAPLRLVL